MGQIARFDERRMLPQPGRILLGAMRVWVAGLHRPDIRAGDRLVAAFDAFGAPEAAALEGFMSALRHGAERTIGVECPCRPAVNADERTLLDILALAQHEQGFEATLLLRGMVSADAACAALDSASRLGVVLARSGMHFDLRHRPALSQFCRPVERRHALH